MALSTAWAARTGELENIDLSRALHDYFRLGDDIEAIYTELRRDPVVARAVEQYAGLRLLRQEPWECLVSYVCSRVKSIRGIRSSVKAIATLSRDTVRLEGDVRHVFPAAQLLAGRGKRCPERATAGLEEGSLHTLHRSMALLTTRRLWIGWQNPRHPPRTW